VLSAEEAAQRLGSLRDPRWREKAADRAGRQRQLAEPFLAAPEHGHFWSAEEQSRLADAAQRVDEMGDRERADLMKALHPGLGPVLDRWWIDARNRPYPCGLFRLAFRAPSSPELTVAARGTKLRILIQALGPLPADPQWLAGWAAYIRPQVGMTEGAANQAFGEVLASTIDLGGHTGDQTLDALIAVGRGEHPVGTMGRHVIVGLLGASRPEGWAFIERLLLAAQLQEGLRQSILEAADEGHPEAFDGLLRVVLDHRLLRFAAAVRAAGVWLGLDATVADLPGVEDRLRKLLTFRTDPEARERALNGDNAADAYTALCAHAQRDAPAAIPEATELARRSEPELRAAAVRFLAAARLAEGGAVVVAAIDDPDIRVAMLAAGAASGFQSVLPGQFEALERLIPRLPERPRQAEGAGGEWTEVSLSRGEAAMWLIRAQGRRPVAALLPWLPALGPDGRLLLAQAIAKEPVLDAGLRQVLVELLGDRSWHVRRKALEALRAVRLDPAEAPAVEMLLTRTASDVRRAALTLLATLPADAARASADRLAASKDKGRRDAGAELRRELGLAADEQIPDLNATLIDGKPCTPPLAPRAELATRTFGSAAVPELLEALDEVVHEHRDLRITYQRWDGEHEVLLADAGGLLWPDGQDMVLRDAFRVACDAARHDDLDLLHAYSAAYLSERQRAWFFPITSEMIGQAGLRLRYPGVVTYAVTCLALERASPALVDACLDMFEAFLARNPGEAAARMAHARHGWQSQYQMQPWYELLSHLVDMRPGLLSPAHIERWYRLMLGVEHPVGERLLVAAFDAGVAREPDAIAAFLSPRNRLFHDLTRHWRGQLETRHPVLVPIADRVRDSLVEVELRRGDMPTPTSEAVRNIASVHGADLLVRLLDELGATPLSRGYLGSTARDDVFSHLIRVSFPGPDDTGPTLAAAIRQVGLPDSRLVDLAIYAPQWARLVEEALGWPGLADGVFWLHAHTKDDQWHVEAEIRDAWAAMTTERTPLDAHDLLAGAVDVDWFLRSHEALGAKRWAVLHQSAKHASGGNGHRRAQVFAEAMLGLLDEAALTERVRAKRNQDAVRALGLVPLPGAAKKRQEAVRRRYAALREFERTSKQFGSQRRASESLAVRIGIENLARTAGYADPQHFIWVIEAREAADLADGPATVTRGETTVTLSVTADGTPDLAVRRADTVLRSVPAAIRKDPEVAALAARKTALTRQAARVRHDLESAMVTRRAFTAADLAELRRHPVLAPMLAALAWVGEDGGIRWQPADDDPALLRIAHPVDLLAAGTWVQWQQRLFAEELRQPFKQVFRELYVLTDTERSSGSVSRRYEGHQVQPRRAFALFTSRGWNVSHESGDVFRVFHEDDLAARVEFAAGWFTPAEADLPTMAGIRFTRRGDYRPEPLESIPPVVFSEAMRDLDLVVSVAHAGGVDPEATASTTEMRAALIRETARLLKLTNIKIEGSHVLIDGTLGEYSLHLGSGTVHRRPGGEVCIVPVGSQHRGRLFLPFADDDPKTAEIVSKALLLARDRDIKDPTILAQLRS
jgi:hypothetical protein